MLSASGKKHFFDMHVQQAQDLTLSVACICIMQKKKRNTWCLSGWCFLIWSS